MKLAILFLMFCQVAVASEGTLLHAYQKEMAFLVAQKRSLQKQINNQNLHYSKKINSAVRKVKTLQDELVMMTSDNERLINRLSEAERTLESTESNTSLIETTLSQAEVTLGIKFNDKSSVNEKLSLVFSEAMKNLGEGSQKYTRTENFFLENGKKVKGQVLHFGKVARFGTYNNITTLLMPVGGGDFKQVDPKNHIQLDFQSSTPFFLYESAEKGIETKKEQNFMEMVHAGGSIAYVIVILGVIAMVLMLFRGVMLYMAGKIDKSLVQKINEEDLVGLEDELKSGNTPFARVMQSTYKVMDRPLGERENVIQESILGELNFLDKFGAVILVMAAIAPLLGLLGTVTGMISTFDIITEFGTGDPKLLSSGISEALITTKLGLMVAIPTLLVGNLFSGRSNKIKIMLEREALRLSNLAGRGKNA